MLYKPIKYVANAIAHLSFTPQHNPSPEISLLCRNIKTTLFKDAIKTLIMILLGVASVTKGLLGMGSCVGKIVIKIEYQMNL